MDGTSLPQPAPAPSAPAALRVGVIGLGVMGGPMAGHLARAGHAVAVHDARRGAAEALAAAHAGMRACASAAELAAHSDIVVTMLPNGHVVRDVVFSERTGLLAGWHAGALLLDTSSAEPWLTRETADRLAAHGIAMVDAPVSGAAWGAEAAELVFMVGGSAPDVARVRPLLDAMGRAVFHLGALGAGHTMKCLNNLVTAVTLAATAEGLALGTRAGLDPAAMTDVLNESTGGSWVSRTHIHQRVLNRRFDDPFKLALMRKDMDIALGLAEAQQVAAPLSAAAHGLWQAADQDRGPGASVSELVRWVEAQMGVEIRSGAATDVPVAAAA
ncbi:NAD(P)-dependent oxidoreductase [Pseudacidovorax intermedius]|uniref:NAD(P)-dependent oxidoreductase n=1 Tax=Pseudacidovorax intermedius TaxID=433924 RepID=UPI0007346CF1|nr:NAD(P)-dependent oxidoreductase [Pseudacidovorax intermedius]